MPTIRTPAVFGCLAGLCIALLAGCGQRGPLFLPETTPPPPPAAEQEPAELGEPVPDVVKEPVPAPAEVDDDDQI